MNRQDAKSNRYRFLKSLRPFDPSPLLRTGFAQGKPLRALRWYKSFLLLPLLLLLIPIALAAQSPELVQAKAKVKELSAQLDKLDETIANELEAALARQADTRPKGEFETTAEHEARLAAAKEARQRLEPEYERKKADRLRTIQEEIETLTSRPYPAPVRIRLGTYDADTQTFPFYVRATGDSGSIEMPREVAKDVKTNLPTLKQTGYWWLLASAKEQLAALTVHHHKDIYIGTIAVISEATLTLENVRAETIAFSPDGLTLASGGKDKSVKLWRVRDGQLLKTLKGHKHIIRSVAFRPDGRLLASCDMANIIRFWQVSDGKLVGYIEVPEEGWVSWLNTIAFSPDGQFIASGGTDNTVKVWRVVYGQLFYTLTGHNGDVKTVAFSPDGQILASGADKTIKLWRMSDGRLLRTCDHQAPVNSVAFSPDGQIIASAGNDRSIKVWRVSDGQLKHTLRGHEDKVRTVAFSPDGQIIASGCYDSTIKFWRVNNGRLLTTITGHNGCVDNVAFSPDGETLASGSYDGTIKLWRVSYVDEQFLAAIRSGLPPAGTPALPPALTSAVSFSEPSGDSILNAEEEGTLLITLTNSGQGAAYGVEVMLKGEAPALSFPARRYLGEIPLGNSQMVSIPIKAGLDIPTGRVTLTCSFTEANGFEPDPIEITFETRAYRPPQLAVADVGVDEPSGNGMIEAGEVVSVMVRVQNRGLGAAENTKARVNIGQNVFTAAGSETEFDLGALAPGEYQDIQFQIYTNRRASEIPVSVTLTERHGRYGLADAPLELPFNQPVRSIQQVVVEGKAGEGVEVVEAGGLSVDIERDIPQGRDERRDAVALVIANRRYLDPDVPDVTFAHRDGEFVKQYLVRTLGYREGNIFLYQDATLSNFRTALKKLQNAARKGSDVFVYYTGHGAPDPDEKAGYFVPVDCDPNYVKIGGVALDEFYRELGGIEAGNVTVVIDACFSGTSEAGMLIREASPVFISVEDPAASLKGGVVLTSASGDQISSWHTEQKHSLYTYYFLKGLQGAADTNGDKSLTVGELQAYLEEQVPYMARRLHNRTQTPTVTPGREERVLVRYE